MGKQYSLTAEERILFYLYDYIQFEDEFEAPFEVTQSGIATGAFIQRKHVPRSLKKLLLQGLINEKLSHVKGAKQRLRVYFLTDDGKEEAKKIIMGLSGKTIVIKKKGKKTTMPFFEYCFTHQVGKKPLEVLLELDLSEDSIPGSKERTKKTTEGGAVKNNKEIYRQMLKKAWEDGRLSRDETELLKEARRILNITEEEHWSIESEILREGKGKLDVEKILSSVISTVLKDRKVSKDEEAILRTLFEALDISKKKRDEIFSNLPFEMEGEGREEKLKIYRSTLGEALKDGHVSRDELALILILKKTLGITEEEHLKVLKELGR